jgi:hypothetical protein
MSQIISSKKNKVSSQVRCLDVFSAIISYYNRLLDAKVADSDFLRLALSTSCIYEYVEYLSKR